MRASFSVAVGSLILGFFGSGCAASGGDGQAPLGTTASREPSATAIVASRLTTLEDAVYNETASGLYGSATSRGHHLVIAVSTGAFVGGYGPRAYVLRDDHVVNPQGTELPGRTGPGTPSDNVAVNTGTHWLTFLGADLSVLDLEGNLVGSRTLPLQARALLWNGERALVLGAAPDADTYAGIQQGQFLDEAGEPLGPVFDIAPGATLLKGGAAVAGSHFVVEYSTDDGAYAVAVSSAGEHGTPVKIATNTDAGSYGLGRGVVSDGQSFLLVYSASADDPPNTPEGPHYRVATVDDSLALTVGDQHVAQGVNPNVTKATFVGGRYLFLDDYDKTALSVAPDGTPQGTAFTWQPFSNTGPTYEISADADGTSAIAIDFSGHAARLSDTLASLDDPPLQVGFGPEVLGISAASFDGSHFRVEWQDDARSSVRTIGVSTGGSVVAPGAQALAGANATASGRWMASNGSSVLRLLAGSSAATLTHADGSVVPVDLSALALGTGYDPAVSTDGTNYLVVQSNAGTALALVSPEGAVSHFTSFGLPGSRNAEWDGTQWVVASGAYGRLNVTPVSADLTVGATKPLLTVPGDLGTWLALASNGAGSFLAWIAHVDNHYAVYGSRVSQALELLDAPGVLLGTTCSWNPPVATSDGTNYWVAWPAEGTCRPAVRRIAAEPLNGNVLLEDSPFIPADPPMGWATLAASPGGPVLLVENPYYSGPLRARVLSEGDPTASRTIGADL